MGEPEISAFLTHLATERQVSASTQNQALAALLFLYRHVLSAQLGFVHGIEHAKRPRLLPVVLNDGEVRAVLMSLRGVPRLCATLMYGPDAQVPQRRTRVAVAIRVLGQSRVPRRGRGVAPRSHACQFDAACVCGGRAHR